MIYLGRPKVIPNPDFTDDWLGSDDGHDCKLEVAEAVLAEAQRIAPVGATGAYRDSLHIEEDSDGEVYVTDGVEYGVYLEFGTNDTPVFAPLRRGASAAGYGSRKQ